MKNLLLICSLIYIIGMINISIMTGCVLKTFEPYFIKDAQSMAPNMYWISNSNNYYYYNNCKIN